jgi:hypothetical protein
VTVTFISRESFCAARSWRSLKPSVSASPALPMAELIEAISRVSAFSSSTPPRMAVT